MSPLSDSKRGIVALALIFCSGGSFLFAQEKSAAPTTDQTKELLERAVAQAESTAAISHQLKDIFQRAARAVVKIHGVDEHSEICGTGFFVDPTGTLYTASTVGGEAGNFTIEFGVLCGADRSGGKNPQRFRSFWRGQTRLDRDQCFGGASTSGRFPRGNDADYGGHAGRPVRDQAWGHSVTSRPEKSDSARRCAGCFLLHHCWRHRPDHGGSW